MVFSALEGSEEFAQASGQTHGLIRAPEAGKIVGFRKTNKDPMDTEQINLIGTLLADLSKRTEQLRGYL
jgi:DNA invertase Pin-like site-specific DNA recombinase